jgi:hypothetical protein
VSQPEGKSWYVRDTGAAADTANIRFARSAAEDKAIPIAASLGKYLEKAIAALVSGSKPDPASTKAVGCTIKKKS